MIQTDRARDLIDIAPLPMALVGPDLRRLQVNAALAQLTGRAAEELIGRPVGDLFLPTESARLAEQERQLLAGAIEAFDAECTLPTSTGPIPVSVFARACEDGATGRLAVLETFVDWSSVRWSLERTRESESRVRSAMLALAGVREPRDVHDLILTTAREVMHAQYAAMTVVDGDEAGGQFVHQGLDPALVDRLGPLPCGRGALSLITADSGPVILEDLREHPASVGVPPGHPAMTSFLGVPVVKDGELLARLYFTNKVGRTAFDEADAELAVALAAHAAGALFNARVHGRMARLVAELDQANAELRELSRQKLEFLASVAHELRTPVHSILIASELVSDPMLGALTEDRMRELGAKIHASGQHLLGLIDDVVDLARLESKNLDLNPEATSLATLVSDAIQAAEPLTRGRDIALAAARSGDARVLVDPLRVRQVLLNLITNAVKFTAPGGRVSVHAVVADRDLRIAVHDTGVGIPEASLERIFEPFERLSSSVAGTGLGLTISRRICELHGGSLEVSSSVGAGSTFVVSLPGVVIPRQARQVARDQTAPPAPSDGPVPVLVVEDDQTARELVSDVLAGAGYSVRQAGSLAAAQRELDRLVPQLIVLDIGLGDGSGLDLARRVRAAGHTMPIAIVSANSTGDDIAEARAVGCSDYMVKPVAARELLSRVHRLVSTRPTAAGC